MVLNGIGASAARRRAITSRAADDHAALPNARALVPVQAIESSEHTTTLHRRPPAPFLAHLIATEQGEPQTRHRCRTEPLDAAHAYAAVSEHKSGGIISRKT
jgi:hypothetical protein